METKPEQNEETFVTDHLMDHFATWFMVSVVSIDLFKIFIEKYRESHPDG
jgi:hypothetical protein